MAYDPDCAHLAWECTPSSFSDESIHSCADCSYRWQTSSKGDCEICGKSESDTAGFVTRDSGSRQEYSSGMVRDTNEGKARWDLLLAKDVPYSEQFLTRVADLLQRGSLKYSARNWEQASTQEEVDRMYESGLRHMMQYLAGETDEDHAAAVVANLLFAETTKWKMDNAPE